MLSAALAVAGSRAEGQDGGNQLVWGVAAAQRLAYLNAAVEVYTGAFLAGFTLPDSATFDQWQFFQRDSPAPAPLARAVSLQGYTSRWRRHWNGRGADDNGNSTIDLELGEGGANGVYVSAQNLARIMIAPAAAGPTGVGATQRRPEASLALVASRLPVTGAATHTTDILLLGAVLLLVVGWLSRGISNTLIQGG